jgi:hypothetical protein
MSTSVLRVSWLLSCLSLVVMLAGCSPASEYKTEAQNPERLHASVWHLTDVMVHDIFSPPQAARSYAYASVAAYEVLAADTSGLRTLAGQLNGLDAVPRPPADEYVPGLASTHALLTVGTEMVYTQSRMETFHDEMMQRFRDQGIPQPVFDRSVAYGDTVAQHVLDWAAADGYKRTRSGPQFTVTDAPGRWRPTPPAYMDAIEPNWDTHRPFVMTDADQFAPTPPHPYSLKEGSPFYEEVMEVYRIGQDLTEEEREIAAFWDCNPYVMHTQGHAMFATKQMSPGGHWMGIAIIANRKTDADLWRSAEVLAQTSVALADGFISAWDEKYRSNLIRPETVINDHIDPDWRPVLQTPPFPEYTSAHSVISAAAAVTLTDLYGDSFAFTDTTERAYGLPDRSYDSFGAAADEAAISRLYGGIHYRMAAEEGAVQGTNVGQWVVDQIDTRPPAVAEQAAVRSTSADRP